MKLEISKYPTYPGTTRLKNSSVDTTTTLSFEVSYSKLSNLSQVKIDKPTERFIAQLLGLCYEPMPYILVALKSQVKVALHLTSKIANILKEYKKFLISLIIYVQPGAGQSLKQYDASEEFILGPEFLEVMKLGGTTPDEKIRLFRTTYPIFGWDVNLVDLDTQVQGSRLISPEVKLYIATTVNMVLKHLTEFKSLAKKYQYLKFPLRYIGGCNCSVGMWVPIKWRSTYWLWETRLLQLNPYFSQKGADCYPIKRPILTSTLVSFPLPFI